MKNVLNYLLDKRFSVYVCGEFERYTDFLGLMKIFSTYSDFFDYTKQEQKVFFRKSLKDQEFYVDANITVKFK